MDESWSLLSRDEEEVVVLRRVDGRVTIWTLRPYGKTWRIVAIRFSRKNAGCNHTPERTKVYDGNCKHGCWDKSKHPNGIRLTGQRVDRVLLDYCEGTRA